MGTRQCFNAPVGKVNINTFNTNQCGPASWQGKPSQCYVLFCSTHHPLSFLSLKRFNFWNSLSISLLSYWAIDSKFGLNFWYLHWQQKCCNISERYIFILWQQCSGLWLWLLFLYFVSTFLTQQLILRSDDFKFGCCEQRKMVSSTFTFLEVIWF